MLAKVVLAYDHCLTCFNFTWSQQQTTGQYGPSVCPSTVCAYHPSVPLLYHSTATDAYIPGLPSNTDAGPEQLDASLKLGHQVEASLQLSAFRRNTAKKMRRAS
ncbi:hypothetical protein WJX79_009527 [Trebouxia sp. C0005]